MAVRFLFLLNSANLICRGTDISKYFRESLGIRDNESRLYWFASFNQFRFLSVLQVCSTKYDPSLQHSDQFDKCNSDPLSVGNRSCCSGTNVTTLILYYRTWINYHCHADPLVFASQIQMTCWIENCVQKKCEFELLATLAVYLSEFWHILCSLNIGAP